MTQGYMVRDTGGRNVAAFTNRKAVSEFLSTCADTESLTVERRYVNTNSVIVWQGPSEIDGTPLVLILTWHSENTKTNKGEKKDAADGMIQTWILRQDVAPIDAIQSGADYSYCGTCIHRPNEYGQRTCYVRLTHGPKGVWDSYHVGNMAWMTEQDYAKLAESGKGLRMGSYGDPAAVSFEVWQKLLQFAKFNTGYTHRDLADANVAKFRGFVMASCETQREVDYAKEHGFRSFRVDGQGTVTIDLPHTIECRATAVGKGCDECKLCGMAGERTQLDIWLPAHGIMAAAVERKVDRREKALGF
jgi:hypothetical protein